MSPGIEEENRHREEMEANGDKEHGETSNSPDINRVARKGKSCKGTLYYSSLLKSKGLSPRCVGLTRSLQQVPSYIVSESEVEASKEGRSLADFKYACVGYSIYLNKNEDAPRNGEQKPRAELPVCVGIELLVDKSPADHSAPTPTPTPSQALNKEGEHGLPQIRPPKTAVMGEEFLTRFTRNAGLVASGVARNMRRVGNYVKDSVDIFFRRPK